MLPVFFKVLNEGILTVGDELTLKVTSGYMRHAYSMRAMNKREAMTREKIMRREVTFHMYIPNLRNCEIFVPQQQTDAEYKDISCERTITPCNETPKLRRVRFIYAKPKLSDNADSGLYELCVEPP